MERTLEVLNGMEADGVFKRYAIGGAVAAIFYVEPFATYDLDIFFVVATGAASALLILEPLYQYLTERGYQPQGEAILIEGWPVQFLPVFNPLLSEAIEQAQATTFQQTPTRVLRAEHLVAIMLQTGRAKDHARVVQFLQAGAVDEMLLSEILTRHQLGEKWADFQRKFR